LIIHILVRDGGAYSFLNVLTQSLLEEYETSMRNMKFYERSVLLKWLYNCFVGSLFLMLILAATAFSPSVCEGRIEKQFDLLNEYTQDVEYYPEKKWSKLASPKLAGWSSLKLEEARQYSESIHSSAVVIIENGVIVAEWGDITERYKLHSVRKSLMSAMIGTLADQKRLDMGSTLKQLKITDTGGLSPKEEVATVHNLLTARSGIYHLAAYETDGMEKKRPLRNSHDPGAFWFYNNWDFNVLVTIFNQVSGKDFFRQFYEKLLNRYRWSSFV
jgi:CubicO group peptidase (beta-lactamase class C family)